MNNAIMFSNKTDEWATPQALFDALNEEFDFDLDPCATEETAKCSKFFTKNDDGLTKNWGGVLGVLQPALFKSSGVGPKVLRRKPEAEDHGRPARSGQDRHKVVSQVHISPGRDTVPQGATEVFRQPKCSTVPVHAGDFPLSGVR